MLETFIYKKVKKHKAEKAAEEELKKEAEESRLAESAQIDIGASSSKHKGPGHGHEHTDHDQAVIRPGDENFLEELISNDGNNEPAPPLPPRVASFELDWSSENDDAARSPANSKDKYKDKQSKKPGRFSSLFGRKANSKQSAEVEAALKPTAAAATTATEAEQEKNDLTKVLDRLNLSVKNNKVISTDSSAAVASFTNIFKDLVNGVPAAYGDLEKLIDDKDSVLQKGFDKLPSSLKKLVTQLPDKITASLGPELLAAAAASQGIKAETSGGLKGTAKNVFVPKNLMQLVTKPGAIVGMLRAIVEVLKTRWPAFIGLNVIWGVALSLLLFVLWYCHKRGREDRLASERSIDGSDRIEELPDDLMLPAPDAPERAQTMRDETPDKVHRQKTSRSDGD
ncbi:hypothetical protein QQS21_010686 [Conoideocrella luteorostrata]|uniref:Ring-like domain-containing protein n=1 Tax=Conoideocrella luteorostrata TaxID=1105319 RepID=A0AAJ0CFH4_9HYPO|nr:hypothetical protein QQS21_010686 [Conoideocrella luteorostrata]